MELVFFSNEFPTDDPRTVLRRLRFHARNQGHRHLAAFLEAATAAVQDEVKQLPQSQRIQIPYIESVVDLADHAHLRSGSLGGAVEGVLLVVTELAGLIGHYELCEDAYSFSADRSCFVGLGIGLLAATAVSMSPTLAHVPAAGAEAVRCAFRLGVFVDGVSQELEPRSSGDSQNSWAYVVAGIPEHEVQGELDVLNESTPVPSKLFVSAANSGSVTVSGPPARLKLLFRESELLRYSKFAALPVFSGLCHAPHLYNRDHALHITDTPTARILETTHHPRIPFLSTESGQSLDLSSVRHLLEDVVLDILTRSIRLENVTDGVNRVASSNKSTDISILAFCPNQKSLLDVESGLQKLPEKSSKTDLLSWINASSDDGINSRHSSQSRIAIVGMACRFPGGGDDLDSFWEILEQGRDVHSKIPPDRFDVDSHYDPTGKTINSTLTPYGCFIKDPSLFDAGFFNMSPREALETDPMHRLALATAYEALERSGFVPNRTAASDVKRVGTFYGQASDDYREVNTAQDIGTYFIPGGCRAFAPGRISYCFGFWGPSFSCDTACSSSLATIQQACTTLWAGDADTVVAGGLNVLTNPDAFAGLGRGHFLSATGNCKTWDSSADGYCRADGVGSVVLKRLEDAEADNDNILGVVLAAATNHSAEAVSITHPHAGAQSELFTKVLNRAGVDPFDVNYVEFHGTGTQAGDSTEMESVTNTFAPTSRRRGPTQPLYIGAVKSCFGHGEAAAGVMALIKVLCMLQHDTIPPHIGIKGDLNPILPNDLSSKRNMHIPFKAKQWSKQAMGRKRLAMINNFSAAGGNTSMLLEEAPKRPQLTAQDTRATQIITVSAKSKVSLKGNLHSMISYLEQNPDVTLGDLSYTTCSRRMHHPFRVAIATSSCDDLKKSLASSVELVDSSRPINPNGIPPVAFAFTGQGSVYAGAGKKLYDDFPKFAMQIQQYDYLCQLHGFPSIVRVVNGSASDDDLTPMVTNLAIVCIEMALAGVWKLLGLEPSIVIGHSLGEYAALHVAGVLSASDTIYLVGKRAELVSQACEIGSHAMLAVRATEDQIEDCVHGQPFEFACRNRKNEIVLSGNRTDMAAVRDTLQASGYRCHELAVPFAFHSAQMDPVLDDFETIARNAIFRAPNVPIISPLHGDVVFDAKSINAKYLRDATRQPVQFVAAMEAAVSMELIDANTAWIEVGPHPICSNFVRDAIPSAKIITSSLRRNEDDWTTMASSCAVLHSAGIQIEWGEYHRPFAAAQRLLDLPKYSWNDKSYWIQYKGTWALTKGNDSGMSEPGSVPAVESPLRTSSVHEVLHEDIQQPWTGSLIVQSDVMHPDFLKAAWGHKMNNCAVVTSSIHADIAFTIAQFMHERLGQRSTECHMNIKNLEVLQGLIARSDTSKPQCIQIKASTDLRSSSTTLHWHNAGEESHFASATVEYGDKESWLAEWDRVAHLVTGRIESLERMEKDGAASKLSRGMTYRLFANLVDYAEKYRGMQSVIINDLEAVAEVKLSNDTSGNWTVPPHFIDSVCHLAGMIMNGGDASDTRDYFYVTPGWESMRFACSLVPGGQYRSYVKMRPTTPGFWKGDVYILQGETVVGMVGGMTFRRFPRVLLGKLFSPPDQRQNAAVPAPKTTVVTPQPPPVVERHDSAHDTTVTTANRANKPHMASKGDETPSKVVRLAPPINSVASSQSNNHTPTLVTPSTESALLAAGTDLRTPASPAGPSDSSTVGRALAIIAREAALDDPAELTDEASFASLGVDSLLSLVLAEKFRDELGVQVRGAQFLECPTIGEFRTWMEEYC